MWCWNKLLFYCDAHYHWQVKLFYFHIYIQDSNVVGTINHSTNILILLLYSLLLGCCQGRWCWWFGFNREFEEISRGEIFSRWHARIGLGVEHLKLIWSFFPVGWDQWVGYLFGGTNWKKMYFTWNLDRRWCANWEDDGGEHVDAGSDEEKPTPFG